MDFKILNELRIKKKFEILNVSFYPLYVFKYFDSLSNLLLYAYEYISINCFNSYSSQQDIHNLCEPLSILFNIYNLQYYCFYFKIFFHHLRYATINFVFIFSEFKRYILCFLSIVD